jgi:peptidoglycan/LPS O-acetylase OafA/YrhL
MMNRFKIFFSTLPERLRRITSGAAIIPEIDGIRFLAIFPVILQHFSERISRQCPPQTGFNKTLIGVLSNGHIGVYIFFFVSGFILALPFGKQKLRNTAPVSIPRYYLRRLTRLEPPYLICMTGFFIFILWTTQEHFGALFPHYLASCFYLHRIIYGEWSPINPLAWTLEIEVQFYLLAPFLALAYFSIRKAILRRVILISLIVLKIIFVSASPVVDKFFLTLPYVIEFFVAGILLTDIYLTDFQKGISKHLVFDFIAVISIVTLFFSWTWDKIAGLKLIFILALFLTVYSSFRSVVVNRFFINRWVTAIGGMCYTIYLLHLGLAEFFVGAFKRWLIISPSFYIDYLLGLLFFLPILFVVCVTFFLLVEKPCMDPNWPSKLRARLSRTATAR